jgi:drug/metabolite transporter (DMT)-like permease
MNNKIIGIVLIVAGVALALWGYDIFDSASSQISRAFNGDTPIKAWLAMAGGVICAAVGISKIR